MDKSDSKSADKNSNKSCGDGGNNASNGGVSGGGSGAFVYKAHLITDSAELFSILDSIPSDKVIAFDCETTGLDYHSNDIKILKANSNTQAKQNTTSHIESSLKNSPSNSTGYNLKNNNTDSTDKNHTSIIESSYKNYKTTSIDKVESNLKNNNTDSTDKNDKVESSLKNNNIDSTDKKNTSLIESCSKYDKVTSINKIESSTKNNSIDNTDSIDKKISLIESAEKNDSITKADSTDKNDKIKSSAKNNSIDSNDNIESCSKYDNATNTDKTDSSDKNTSHIESSDLIISNNGDKMVGFSFCFDGENGYYVPFLHTIDMLNTQNDIESKQISLSDAKLALQKIFTHDIIGHNIKFDLQFALHNFGIYPHITKENIESKIRDSIILAWLLNPSAKLSLDSLMKEYFNHDMISFDSVLKQLPSVKGVKNTFANVELKKAAQYAAEDAVATFRLYYKLESLLDSTLLKEASKSEFPFIHILVSMENSGICVSRVHFIELKREFDEKIKELTKKIHTESGAEFNINSPKQTSEILFDKLGLDTKGNKQKSTNEIYLQSLIGTHPVVASLLEYREVFKLYSTYIEPILKRTLQSDIIHTEFWQTGTATGRLSSKSPNLQNISVRTQMGKSIRAGFKARKGYMLASLDYSQIELRLLAHFSGDSTLINAFKNNEDIHTQSAKMIFGDDVESSSDFDTLRSVAKSINFGLIYGMGARKLAQTLQIAQSKAKEYIDTYFSKLPNIKNFLESKKEEIEIKGYAETLFHRKRYFSFYSANEFVRQGYLREGVNTIFQGSAADLIKKSMNEIYREFGEFGLNFGLNYFAKSNILFNEDSNMRLLLQVHDELIFEIKNDLVETYTQKIKNIMESIYTLKVPLLCNVKLGTTWDALK